MERTSSSQLGEAAGPVVVQRAEVADLVREAKAAYGRDDVTASADFMRCVARTDFCPRVVTEGGANHKATAQAGARSDTWVYVETRECVELVNERL